MTVLPKPDHKCPNCGSNGIKHGDCYRTQIFCDYTLAWQYGSLSPDWDDVIGDDLLMEQIYKDDPAY
ncbi:hypothetical protein NDI45_20385 [Leptolyngbya sp. GB1-A1]|uniref:hypothetical protein n=1 Tax=Leptolyngbya sp. GB1-A1 TaxID=2933908 RepID=UPI00329A77FA